MWSQVRNSLRSHKKVPEQMEAVDSHLRFQTLPQDSLRSKKKQLRSKEQQSVARFSSHADKHRRARQAQVPNVVTCEPCYDVRYMKRKHHHPPMHKAGVGDRENRVFSKNR